MNELKKLSEKWNISDKYKEEVITNQHIELKGFIITKSTMSKFKFCIYHSSNVGSVLHTSNEDLLIKFMKVFPKSISNKHKEVKNG